MNDRLKRITEAVWFLLLLAVVAGCASSAKLAPGEGDVAAAEVSVERLDDGRSGFVLEEESQLDGDLRDRFEEGVEALEEEEYQAAVDAFSEVVEAHPGQTAPQINLAAAHMGLEQTEEAEEPLQKALRLVPGHPLASHRYGLLLRRQGRFDEARQVYETALEEFPEYHPIRRNLAILCDLYIGDLEYALEQYEIYAEERPDDEQVKVWIAELRGRLER